MVWGGRSDKKSAFFEIERNSRGASSHDQIKRCNNNSSVFISLLGSCGRKLSLAEEGRKVVSEQATLASLEPRTTSHFPCSSTR